MRTQKVGKNSCGQYCQSQFVNSNGGRAHSDYFKGPNDLANQARENAEYNLNIRNSDGEFCHSQIPSKRLNWESRGSIGQTYSDRFKPRPNRISWGFNPRHNPSQNVPVLVCAHALYSKNTLCCSQNVYNPVQMNSVHYTRIKTVGGSPRGDRRRSSKKPYEYYFFKSRPGKTRVRTEANEKDPEGANFESTRKGFSRRKKSRVSQSNPNWKIFRQSKESGIVSRESNFQNEFRIFNQNNFYDPSRSNGSQNNSRRERNASPKSPAEPTLPENVRWSMSNKKHDLKIGSISGEIHGLKNDPEVFQKMYRNKLNNYEPEDSIRENDVSEGHLRLPLRASEKGSSRRSSGKSRYISSKTVYKELSQNNKENTRFGTESKSDWMMSQHPGYSYANANKIAPNLAYFYGSFQKFESPKFTFQGRDKPSIHREAGQSTHPNDPFSLRCMAASPKPMEEIAQRAQYRASYFGSGGSQRSEKPRRIQLIKKWARSRRDTNEREQAIPECSEPVYEESFVKMDSLLSQKKKDSHKRVERSRE